MTGPIALRRLLSLSLAAWLLAGCPEDRGESRQRVPSLRVPPAVSLEPSVPPMPLPPAALEPGDGPAPAVTSGR